MNTKLFIVIILAVTVLAGCCLPCGPYGYRSGYYGHSYHGGRHGYYGHYGHHR